VNDGRPRVVRPLFPADEVETRIGELADAMWTDYAGGAPPILLSIAEGAVRFTEALVDALRARDVRPEVETVRARRTRGTALGALQIEAPDLLQLEGRDVVVVDDIADEGRTLRGVLDLLEDAECRSLRTAVLVDKRERRREPLRLDYVGFRVERGWVVGFGMDLDGELRDLDEIGVVEET